MKVIKISLFYAFFALFWPLTTPARPLESPSYGFSIDLPEGYEFVDGNGRENFSFKDSLSPSVFDLFVYKNSRYLDGASCMQDIMLKLGAKGDTDSFYAYDRDCIIANFTYSLQGSEHRAWALVLPLIQNGLNGDSFLLAISSAPLHGENYDILHFSALDSIAIGPAEKLQPGPISCYAWPENEAETQPVFALSIEAQIGQQDAQANQMVVDREAELLRRYGESPLWQEAWQRFYRRIYCDALSRLKHVAFQVERYFSPKKVDSTQAPHFNLLARGLSWVQGFTYERDLQGSDFVNLVSAALEGRGDCDSRAMLLAIILEQAGVPARIMVSPKHSHAMLLADVKGKGGRFPFMGTDWLVGETTAKVAPGQIAQSQAAWEDWIGIDFMP